MSVLALGLVWVLGAVVLVAGFALLIRKNRPNDLHDNVPLNTVLTLVGGLHAVLVVFVLIGLFDSVGTARGGTYREADGLVAVSWAANALPEPSRTRIHDLSRAYLGTVLDREWPRMRDADAVETTGWTQLTDLQRAIDSATATGDWQEERRKDAKDRLWEVYQARQERLSASTGQINLVVWLALALGSLATITLTYLVSGLRLTTYLIMVCTVTGVIALLLFAIFELQNPFGGGANLSMDAFRSALTRLG